MFTKDIAVVAITRVGVDTALRIKEALEKSGLNSKVYAPKKYSQNGVVALETNFADFIKQNYSSVDALIGIMATGIIIRSVAPLLESKLTDPAIIGVDSTGRFVISLLSGHYGGANELTKIVADGIGATAVITTASEAMGKQSVDDLARQLHLSIQNPESLVGVNSAIVNGDKLVVVVIGSLDIPLEKLSCYDIKKVQNGNEALDVINNYDAGIIVTNEPVSIHKFNKPFTILKARRLVVGLGARKQASIDSMIQAVCTGLKLANMSIENVNSFATVDIKKDSPEMITAVKQLGKPLEFLSVDTLASLSHKDLSADSKLVKEKIGVGGVCERAALIAAGKNSRLILKKTKLNGVTIAIAEGE